MRNMILVKEFQAHYSIFSSDATVTQDTNSCSDEA